MAQFSIFRSTDSGAPVLHGQTGSLITVLDAVLVNGYGGTGSLGWTKAFSSSYDTNSVDNKAAYKMPTKQCYLRIYDGTEDIYKNTSWVRMDEYLTSVTSSTFDVNIFVRKSNAISTSPRDWMIMGDSKTFYMFVLTQDAVGRYYGWMFGEFDSYIPNDPFNVMISGRRAGGGLVDVAYDTLEAAQQVDGQRILRPYYRLYATSSNNSTSEVAFFKIGSNNMGSLDGSSVNMCGFGNIAYTNPEDSKLYIGPLYIIESSNYSIRGRMRGFWQWMHPVAAVNDLDTFSGTGNLSGKTFLIIKSAPRGGIYLMETSNTLS